MDRTRRAPSAKDVLVDALSEWTDRILKRGLQTASARRLADACPALVVLVTKKDEPADWISAGRLLARTFLRALHLGARPSFVNSFMSYPHLRDELARRLGPGRIPQIGFRLGVPARSSRTPIIKRDLQFEEYL